MPPPLPLRLFGLLLLLAPAFSPGDASALSAAEAALRDGFAAEAARQFEPLGENGDPRALLGLARARLASGKLSEAQRVLDLLPEELPEEVATLAGLVRADLALLRGEFATARALLAPPPPTAEPFASLHTRLLARLLVGEQKPEAAVTLLQAHVEADPDNEALRTDYARLLDQLGRPDHSMEHWRILSEGPPALAQTQEAKLRLLQAAHDRGDKTETLSRMRAFSSEGRLPDELLPRAHALFATLLAEDGQFLEAARHLLALEGLGGDPPVLADLRIRRADLLIQAGQIAEGRQLLSQQIAARGDHPLAAIAQLRLARTLAAQENPTETAQAYETYLSVFSNPEGVREARLGLATLREQQNAWGEAADLYEKVFLSLPDTSELGPHVWLKRADALAALGRNAEARDLYLQLPTKWPRHELVSRALFQAASLHPEVDRAVEELRRLRDNFPDDPLAERAQLQQGLILFRAGRLERALGAFDAYLERYPQGDFLVDAIAEKGITAYRSGFFDLALRQFERVLAEYPAHPRTEQASAMRAWCLYLNNRDEEAVRAGRRFLKEHADSPLVTDMRFWLGELAFNKTDYAGAEQEFLAVAETGAPSPSLRSRALYLAGRAALARREFETALARFNASLTADPEAPHAPDALFHQGDALTELNRFDAAIVVFDQLLTLFPASALANAARGRKGDCQYTLGEQDPERYRQALATWRLVDESSTARPSFRLQAVYKMGRALLALQQREEALAHFLRVIHGFQKEQTRMDSDAEFWFVRAATDAAQAFEQDQKWREAIQVYRALAEASLSQSPEAARRIETLRREHLILF